MRSRLRSHCQMVLLVAAMLLLVLGAPNSPQTVPLTGTGGASSLGVASGGTASATVAAGSAASYALTIGGAGMSGTASLACTGAPIGATCSVPASVTLSATTASTFNASITTTARSLAFFTCVRPAP